ncbi:hypothetical protein SAMN04489752_0432 [Brevibacterium siliguriense]|uniref:Uncharacterized protein n=1 Tax=Brevibacterium siliguriense TaxID=1136497 RepID=A0A1H1MFU6_9MICO|nr:hypothetical protein [Brevibacterium siliguriense]SDR85520.1 hypothetical protein SAMN04489752_0432 [Brevibacterium siliguriense]
MSSFFDSPEFHGMAAGGNISHSPGMGDRMMRELAPFLKAEGVDIDDPKADFTEAEFHAAMEKAQGEYNRRLFNPTGAHRGLALGKLRSFALAFAEGDINRAEAVVASLPSDPEDFNPSVAQVTGSAMGLVDEWFTDDALGPKLGGVMAPKWSAKKSRAVARDILALAHKGRVVDSLDRLITSNSGLPVLEGSMLAVAAAVVRLTKRDRVSAQDVVDELMPLDGYPEPVAGTYRPADRVVQDVQEGQDDPAAEQDLPEWLGGSNATGHAAGAADPSGIDERMDEVEKTVYEMPLYRRFRDWLAETYDDVDEDSEVFDIAHLLFCIAVSSRADIDEPEGIDDLLDVLESFAADGQEESEKADGESPSTVIFLDSLEALDNYLRFRMDTDETPERWSVARGRAEAASMRTDPLPSALMAAVEANALSEEQLAQPMPQNRLVEGVVGILDWIGDSRPLTGTGRVKRADIAEAAGKFGIKAVGVASNARYEDGVNYARSADEVPVLEAMWAVMQSAEITEITGTKVRPGSAADEWKKGEVGADTALPVIGAFIYERLLDVINLVPGEDYGAPAITIAQRLIEILTPDSAPERPELDLGEVRAERLSKLLADELKEFTELGLLTADGDALSVEPVYKRIVAGAALMLLSGPRE